MASLLGEVSANFEQFTEQWKNDLNSTLSFFDDYYDIFRDSYLRISSVNSWRLNLFQGNEPDEALAFFCEAQNDLISGHIMARAGAWRFALKSIRSFIENVLAFLYFKDHPIELELWRTGKYKPTFSGLQEYFRQHPRLHGFEESCFGNKLLKHEYSVLSRAVHASGKDFRMTSNGEVNEVFSADYGRLKKWATREHYAIKGINILLCHLYRVELSASKKRDHRKVISASLSQRDTEKISESAGINLVGLNG